MAMTRKQKRLAVIGGAFGFLALATTLTLFALGQKASYFYTPADVAEKGVAAGERIRLGGLVATGSIARAGGTGGTDVSFAVTDRIDTVTVSYSGILPDLFREEQGVIAEGSFDASGHFVADTVLARHDENYMPREVADSMKARGIWQEGE